MEPTSSFFATVLPQLGVGSLSLVVLGYLSKYHSDKMEKKDKLFMEVLQERETAFRTLEREVRISLTEHIGKSAAVLDRAIARLDK